MSEAEIIHDAELIGTELVPVPSGNLFRTEDPVEVIRRATDVATPLAHVLRERKLYKQIGNKNHVLVEGWTLLGSMLGVFPVVVWTRPIEEGGWEARVEARTLAGQVVGAAEAECLRSEKEWGPTPTRGKMRDDYALRSMAQTRAVSKALRGPLGFVVTLAGFDPTPAEEMPREPIADHVVNPKGVAVPKSWAKLTELVSAYDQTVHDVFFEFADSARRYLFPDSTDTKSLSKGDRDHLFRVCAGAAVRLRESFEPSALPYPTVDDLRAVFAAQLDGLELQTASEVLDEEAAEAAQADA